MNGNLNENQNKCFLWRDSEGIIMVWVKVPYIQKLLGELRGEDPGYHSKRPSLV